MSRDLRQRSAMTVEEKRALNALVSTYEAWRDKRLTRTERAAALGSLATFAHHMGLSDELRAAVEANSNRRRA
jgi:hypothetical protein